MPERADPAPPAVPGPDPADAADALLLGAAARAAAPLALDHARDDLDVVFKPGDAGPVTAADLAVNADLHGRLVAARPGYGWLSEESPDDARRLARTRTFIIDPIDGTRSFIDGARDWGLSLAVADRGTPVAAAVMMPRHGTLYLASRGGGASRDGVPLAVSGRTDLAAATVLAGKPSMAAHHWRRPPPFQRKFRSSLAYRLALVAEGRFDAMISLAPVWEWDVAAGALLVAEAGGVVTDRTGAPLRFNAARPQADGIVAAPPALHAALCDHLAWSAGS